MMDFGFGAFLERFESHFGSRATKFVLALIGLAVVITCLTLIWSQLINPLIKLFAPSAKNGDFLTTAFSAAWIGVGGAAGYAVGEVLKTIFVTRRIRRLEARLEERESMVRQLKESMTASGLALEELAKVFADENRITPETADSILSLLKTEPGTPL